VQYQTVFNLDTGKTAPELETLLRACTLLRYTPNQLIYGHEPPEFALTPLTDAQVGAAATRAKAPFEALQDFHALRTGPGGEYLVPTAAFVSAYFDAYTRAFVRGDTLARVRAADEALIAATQGAAVAAAIELDAKPVTAPATKRKRTTKRRR
jgi:hypothetical protein